MTTTPTATRNRRPRLTRARIDGLGAILRRVDAALRATEGSMYGFPKGEAANARRARAWILGVMEWDAARIRRAADERNDT